MPSSPPSLSILLNEDNDNENENERVMDFDEYDQQRHGYFVNHVSPIMEYTLQMARIRYDFVLNLHSNLRASYIRKSYWNSWLGVWVAILSALQQIVMTFIVDLGHGNSSYSATVTGFLFAAATILCGAIIQSNSKTIKQHAHFTQSLNEQIYAMADFIQSRKTQMDHWLPNVSKRKMDETMLEAQNQLNATTYATSKVIETFDGDVVSCTNNWKLLFGRNNSTTTQQSAIGQWNELLLLDNNNNNTNHQGCRVTPSSSSVVVVVADE